MKDKIQSFIILFILAIMLVFLICIFNIPPHISIMSCILILLVYGTYKKIKWQDIENSMVDGIFQAMKPIFILSLIGILIGVWMMSGTIPTILYYGIKYISPKWYYINCVLICIITSSFNGSSIATVSTIGVALIGVAEGLGLPLNIAAGAIICGACFGDKCSPLSDSTNLAPGVVDINLYDHVKHLIWTTIPSIVITLIIFFFLGHEVERGDLKIIENINLVLNSNFNISIITLLPPLLVFFLSIKKLPALPTFIVGILTGLLITALVQKNINITEWANVMQNGFILKESGNQLVPKLLNRGGLQSMMGAISLIAIALSFGALLKKIGIIDDVISSFSNKLKSRSTITIASSLSCILVNFLSGEMFLSIILPGKAFKNVYLKNNIPLKNLSRTLEDCGTLVNPLIPWGVSGAFFSSALGVSVIDYLPFVFFLYLSPIFTILFGFTNIDNKIFKKKIK